MLKKTTMETSLADTPRIQRNKSYLFKGKSGLRGNKQEAEETLAKRNDKQKESQGFETQ